MIVVDVETTGLNPLACSIIEIGAVDFNNPDNQFEGECSIWDGAEVNPKSLEWNGQTIEDITNPERKTLKQLIIDFTKWLALLEDQTMAGQNIDFDISFLNDSSRRYNLGMNFGRRKVDQHSFVYAHLVKRGLQPPLKNNASAISGDYIMKYVGIPAEPKPHSALNGAIFECEALSRIINGTSIMRKFKDYEIPDYLKLP